MLKTIIIISIVCIASFVVIVFILRRKAIKEDATSIKYYSEPILFNHNLLNKQRETDSSSIFPDIELSPKPNPLEGLKEGYLKVTIAQIMNLGKDYDIFAVISNLKTVLYHELPNNDFEKINDIEQIIIARVVKLKLTGNDFEITEINEPKQFLIFDDLNIWKWIVKPIRSGKHKLVLKISVELNFENLGNQVKDITVHEKVINIKIGIWYILSQFFIKNWKWFLGAILGSGVIWKLLEIWSII